MKRKISIQLFGVISYALTQWLLMLYFAHMYGLEEAAKYIYYLAVFTPLSIFFSYGLRNGIASDKDYNFSFISYINVSYIGAFLYLVCAYLFFNFFSDLNLKIFLFTLIFKFSELICEPYYGNFLRRNLSFRYALSRMYKLFFGIVFFVPFYFLEHFFDIDYLGAFGFLISLFILFYFYDRADKGDVSSGNDNIYNIIWFNFPLAASAMVIAFNSSLPKIILGYENQGVDLAIFGFLLYMNSIAILPITALIQILYGKNRLNININKYLFFYSLFYFVSFLFLSPYVLKYFFNVNGGYGFISLVLTGILGVFQFYLTINNFILTYYRKFNFIFKLSLLSIFINLIICFFLLNYGLNGIITSVLISTLASCIFGHYVRIKFCK
jgi:O-antigen/teichoic acid export membrane protein